METIKHLFTFFFCGLLFLYPQKYEISIWGYGLVDVIMNKTGHSINFSTQTTGLLDMIWPASNSYSVVFDSVHFGLRSYEKKIKQGDLKYKLKAEYNEKDNLLKYDKVAVQRPENIQSIFTLLARIQVEHPDDVDAKWLPMDHEEQLFSARFLWADSIEVEVDGTTYQCDHYRLDIKALEDVTSIPVQRDYFMNNITGKDMVRQIWVEKKHPRRIIQAAVKITGMTIVAKINNE